jgi:hypothetical protein
MLNGWLHNYTQNLPLVRFEYMLLFQYFVTLFWKYMLPCILFYNIITMYKFVLLILQQGVGGNKELTSYQYGQ